MNADTISPAAERAEADTVSFTVAEQIAWVKFNRPEKRNCMSPKLNRQMMRVLDEPEFRADVVGEMTYDNAEDFLVRAQEAANSYDNEGRKEGIKQFIDDKSFKPGLAAYDRSHLAGDATGL